MNIKDPLEAPKPDMHAHPEASPAKALAISAVSSVALAACGGGSDGPGPAPGPAPAPPPPPSPLTLPGASRFLSQAAIGYGRADVDEVYALGVSAWLDKQIAMPRQQKCWDYLVANGYAVPANANTSAGFDPMIWSQLMSSQDILRQRVGLALLSQWVVSIDGINTSWRAFSMAAYLDILWDHAFGNFRDLMEAVSTSAAMGSYLTYLGSTKANAKTGAIPDENYARELMQLFTIGLYKLNMDGSLVLSGGKPVPTYGQEDVSALARVWTGYSLANNDNTAPDRYRIPMAVLASRFETGASTFLGISIPAGSDPASARKIALEGLFNHPNVPPFVSKQLIQRMVTSNPSPGYIQRVAQVFANNGKGVRGDLAAVVRAILLDNEARNDAQALASASFGKVREPVIRLVQWAKAFKVTSPTNLWPFGNTSSSANRLSESPGHSPSVFNWFRPGYTPPGTKLASAGLVAPEMQLSSEPSIIAYANAMQGFINTGAGEAKPDYNAFTTIAADAKALVDELNLVLAAGQINASTLTQIKAAVETVAATTAAGLSSRVYAAILLVMVSPDYLVQR